MLLKVKNEVWWFVVLLMDWCMLLMHFREVFNGKIRIQFIKKSQCEVQIELPSPAFLFHPSRASPLGPPSPVKPPPPASNISPARSSRSPHQHAHHPPPYILIFDVTYSSLPVHSHSFSLLFADTGRASCRVQRRNIFQQGK